MSLRERNSNEVRFGAYYYDAFIPPSPPWRYYRDAFLEISSQMEGKVATPCVCVFCCCFYPLFHLTKIVSVYVWVGGGGRKEFPSPRGAVVDRHLLLKRGCESLARIIKVCDVDHQYNNVVIVHVKKRGHTRSSTTLRASWSLFYLSKMLHFGNSFVKSSRASQTDHTPTQTDRRRQKASKRGE